MWLLNASTYALKFFHTAKTAPPYAILSHTWEDDEVLFKDMDNLERAKAKSGWQKIEYICRQALDDGLEWAWVDTCCIDKSSSAELSEAINSMFNWYKFSTVCYVYLCDLTMTATLRDDVPMVSTWLERAKKMAPIRSSLFDHELHPSETVWREHEAHFKKVTSETMSAMRNDNEGYSRPCNESEILLIDTLGAFSRAKWWSRGWTLQELIAPWNVAFMDQHWQQIARLLDVVVTVSTISSVDVAVLLKTAPLQSRCIAERLSWASKRSTTREEDTAYALFGIFDANMPLLYGEGSRAFERLQEVISQRSNDLSIYAWPRQPTMDKHLMYATAPSYFAGLSAVRTRSLRPTTGISVSFMGVTLTSRVYRKYGHYYIDLGCYDMLTPNLQIMLVVFAHENIVEKLYSWLRLKTPIVYPLAATATSVSEDFARMACSRSLTTKYHKNSGREQSLAALLTVHLPKEQQLPVENAYPREHWNRHSTQFYSSLRDLAFPVTAGLEFKTSDGYRVCLALRLDLHDRNNSSRLKKDTVSSGFVYDRVFTYQCSAELVLGLSLDQACTQFSSWHPQDTPVTDVANFGHLGYSQNISRLAIGERQLTVEVGATKHEYTPDHGIIEFDIFIIATTPTTE